MAEETSAQQAYDQFWPRAIEEIRSLEPAGLKHQELPLARIKKVSFYNKAALWACSDILRICCNRQFHFCKILHIHNRHFTQQFTIFLLPDHETRRGCQNDFCRSSCSVRQSCRDLHSRVDDESLDPHRRQQETNPPKERHRNGHHQVKCHHLCCLA